MTALQWCDSTDSYGPMALLTVTVCVIFDNNDRLTVTNVNKLLAAHQWFLLYVNCCSSELSVVRIVDKLHLVVI